MDKTDSTPGTVYFAISITILFMVFWRADSPNDLVPIAVAAAMAMTWGDAFASLMGKRWGRRTYSIFKHKRSIEGSLAMFLFSLIAILLTLTILPGSQLSPATVMLFQGKILLYTVISALVATIAEAVAPAGTDNLSVPLVTAACLWLMI